MEKGGDNILPENIHDKGYKRILSVKKNFLDTHRSFIREPWVWDITEDNLTLIDKEFILKDFTEKEADIIYKVSYKGREFIFYCLLELQSGVDYTMPFRLLIYIVELMRRIFLETPKDVRESASFRLPAVIPMVLYNGAERWTAKQSFKEYLSEHELFGGHVIDFNYILLDVNNYDTETLTEIGNLISAVFMLDREQNETEFIKSIQKVLELFKDLSFDEQSALKSWINDVLRRKAGAKQGIVDETIEILEMERKGENMTYAIERLWDRIEARGEAKGIERGIEQTVIKMLKKNRSIDEINESTEVSEDKILRLKEKLGI